MLPPSSPKPQKRLHATQGASNTFTVSAWRRLGAVGVWLLLAGAGCAERNPSNLNCGLHALLIEDWTAPEGCICTDPEGRLTWTPPGGQEEPVVCEDLRLQACPSTSGRGCGLIGMPQAAAEEGPALVEVHHDIGGHIHDLCCAQNYSTGESGSFSTTCNGCTAQDPEGPDKCPDLSGGDALIGIPFNPEFPCAVEWRYATTAFLKSSYAWWAPVDTQLRWTGPQVIERNMAGTPGPYTRPDGRGGRGVPLFGQALAPSDDNLIDQRAPTGTLLGLVDLSSPFHPDRQSLGLSARQIGSFCQSEHARLDARERNWVCDERVSR